MRAAVRLSAHRYRFGRQFDVQAIRGSDGREMARRWGTTMRCVREERVQWAVANAASVASGAGAAAAARPLGAAGALELEHEIYATHDVLPGLLGGPWG